MGTIAMLSGQGAARVETLPGFEGRYVEADGYVLGVVAKNLQGLGS